MHIAIAIFAGIAVAAWVVMAIAALQMLRYRRRSILWLAMNGWAWFSGEAFGPEAKKYRRRFIRAAAAFAAGIICAAAAAVARFTWATAA